MSHAIVITGTDTGIGKTVFSAALAGALDGYYWKPVQAGLDEGSDAQTVARLSGLSPARIVPEAYRLTTPCSPHLAAEIDGISIDVDALHIPATPGPLVIEGAGGALVPLTRSMLFADLFARWALPLVIVARTGLGTINHSLMTIECLRARGIEPLGIAFVGEAHPDSEAIISTMGRIRRLGRLDPVEPLDQPSLAAAFARGFDPGNFR